MSGQVGMRGYLIQSLISVIDSFNDVDWISIILEPDVGNDKVDILWKYPSRSRAVQIKSSQNQITKGDCIKWVDQIESSFSANEYELILIGPVNADVGSTRIISKTKIPIPSILNISSLLDQASNKFDKFLEQRSISKVPVFAREILIQSLVIKFEEYSTAGKEIKREDFTKTFDDWILAIYPDSVNKAAEELKIQFESRNRIEEAKFKLKYEACMEALSVVDQFHLRSFKNQIIEKNISGIVRILSPIELGEKARICHNKLVLTCDSADVIQLYRRAIKLDNKPEDRADIVVDLRAAIRKELGFGTTIVDLDREKAWIAMI